MIIAIFALVILAIGAALVFAEVRRVLQYRSERMAAGARCFLVTGQSRKLRFRFSVPLAVLEFRDEDVQLSLFKRAEPRHHQFRNEQVVLRWRGPTLVSISDPESKTTLYPWLSNRSPSEFLQPGLATPVLRASPWERGQT